MSYVRSVPGEPIFALVSLVVEVLFCNQGVEVRFLPGAPIYPSVGKSGLIRLVWDQEIEGSNPSTRTSYIAVDFWVRSSPFQGD